MPANTTRAGLPYPLGTDPVSDGDDAIKNLANRLDGSTGNAVGVPFSFAVGNVTCPAPASVPQGSNVAVTFPVGRFTVVPHMFGTNEGTSASPAAISVANITTAGANVFRWQLAGTANAATVRWVAYQMTSSAASG